MEADMEVRTPKHRSVMQGIADLITDASPGTPLATERELADRFATSRTTVRQALAALEAAGRVERTQGRGTFVAQPRRVFVRQLTSFSEDLRDQGHEPSSRIIDISRPGADRATAEALGVGPGTRITRIERLRLVDGETLAVEIAHLAGPLPRIRAELERVGSLYTALRDVYDRPVVRVEDVVEAAYATPREAALLGIDLGVPMLVIGRRGFTHDDELIEYTRCVFRGDRFQFQATLTLAD